MKLWVAVTASMVLTGCSTFSKASEKNLYQVHVGESKSELIEALGNPQSRTVSGTSEKWFYSVYAADNRKIYPYTATFENDKLLKWDFDTARVSVSDDPPMRTPASINRRPY